MTVLGKDPAQPAPPTTESSLNGLIALSSNPPEVDAGEAEQVASSLYGIAAAAVPLSGERDRNFRLSAPEGVLVLKFIDPGVDDTVVAGQSAVLTHLARQAPELPVPRIVRTRAGCETGLAQTRAGTCRVRLVTYLSGRLLLDVKPGSPLLRATGRQIAALDLGLRGFEHPALSQRIAWDVRQAPLLASILPRVAPPAVRELTDTALEPLPRLLQSLRDLRSQAIHGDCHPRHLLVNEAADACSGIIDLGDMVRGPIAMEIGVAMAECLLDGLVPPEQVGELLAGYASLVPLERAEVEVLYDLILARTAVTVLIQTWRANRQVTAGPGLEPAALEALERLVRRGRLFWTTRWKNDCLGPDSR